MSLGYVSNIMIEISYVTKLYVLYHLVQNINNDIYVLYHLVQNINIVIYVLYHLVQNII